MSGGGSGTQYFSLRWNNHPVNLVSVFTGLYQVERDKSYVAVCTPSFWMDTYSYAASFL